MHLTTVAGAFHARVLAARLGAEGLLAQLRGAVDGPYPMGAVAVYVPADELERAREILALDEAAALRPDDHSAPGLSARAPARRRWPVVAAAVVALVLACVDLLAKLV